LAPRVSQKEKVKRILDIFSHEDRVLLPLVADPDAMASAMAFRRLLWHKVASSTIARVNEIQRSDNATMIRLLRLHIVPLRDVRPADYSKIVLLDGQPEHHDALAGLNYSVIIDHHPLLESSRAAYLDVRPGYGATATIMTGLLRAAGIVPSRSLATALLYAIKTDTDTFSRPTLAEDVAAFRYLYRYADQNLIRKFEYSEIPLSLLKYYRLALDRIRIRSEKAFAFLGRVNNPDAMVMVADFLMRIQTIDTAVTSGLHEDLLIVIFRNAKGRRNVGRLAQRAFGRLGRAGGHMSAARAEVHLAALKEAGVPVEDEAALERFVIKTIRVRAR